MKIKYCRNCNSNKIKSLFSFGKISYTGKFPKKNINIPKANLSLVICSKCKLVQLGNKFNLNYLYGPDYGYRTGINKTMVNHVKRIVKNLSKKVKLKKKDHVLDIASNDGTMLNFYKKNIITFGIDPIINKFNKNYKNINYKLSDFFSYNKIKKITKNKFKIITALSVFYDLSEPNKFLNDASKLLDKNGILLLEFADLESIIKFKMFDTICHEHLEYYSTEVLIKMIKKNNLKLIDIKSNKINGSSKQYFLCKQNSKYKINRKIINKYLKKEKKYKLKDLNTYKKFFKNINDLKSKINKFIIKENNNNKNFHCYGASTKGNVLLQYFGITNKLIKYAAERNPNKYNHYTPGSKIKIISEKLSRSLKPDYYIVLPWHFKKEILKRERKILKKGTKLIFPLPNFRIYG